MVQTSPFFLTNFLRIWPNMKFSPISFPPLWFNAPCPFVDKGHQTIVTSLWLHVKILHSDHSRNPSKFWSLVYCEELFNSTKNLCSMTYLYFSKLVFYLFTKALSRYAIVCSMKNVMTILWNCCVAICLRSLSSSFWHSWDCVHEGLTPLEISAIFYLCMVKGGPLKGLGG
jgi:hypothetical protein